MVWVIFAGVGIAFAVLALWAATRRDSIERVMVERRFDLVRSGLALVSGVIALVAALDAHADETIEFPPILGILCVAALSCAALAFLPSRGAWSDNRRLAAAIIACLWVAIGLATWPFAIAASACACSGAGPYYVPPAPLGIEARGWLTIATLCGPVLLLLAASRLPDRLRRTAA